MTAGFGKTFTYLRKSDNGASLDVLTTGMTSNFQLTRSASLRALMGHKSIEAKKVIFRHLDKMTDADRKVFEERPDRLGRAITQLLKTKDPEIIRQLVQCIMQFKLYDMMPLLSSLMADSDDALTKTICKALKTLAQDFYTELCNAKRAVDLDTQRRKATVALEEAVGRFKKHQDKEVIDSFLMVTKSTNATLKRMLQSPKEVAHKEIIERLNQSEHGGVMRLLLGYLDDPHMPVEARNAICKRTDLKFVDHLLKNIHLKSLRVVESVNCFDQIGWAVPGHETLMQLDGEQQAKAIEVVCITRMARSDILAIIIDLLKNGKVEARRVAAERIANFEQTEATEAVVQCIEDEDPHVKAHLLAQLRPRDVRGAMFMLIRMADIDALPVKLALRETMPEFSFTQFFNNFDHLPDEMMTTTGYLVSKVDVDSITKLTKELVSLSPVRRRKAVRVGMHMGVTKDIEQQLIELLNDEDHTVRIATAEALAACDTMPTWEALRDALMDKSVIVREIAEESLKRISKTLAQDGPSAELELSTIEETPGTDDESDVLGSVAGNRL